MDLEQLLAPGGLVPVGPAVPAASPGLRSCPLSAAIPLAGKEAAMTKALP
jgi:hypothetical protein